jgi:hypothetical protein
MLFLPPEILWKYTLLSNNEKKNNKTFYGQNSGLLNIKTGGTRSYHFAIDQCSATFSTRGTP